MQHIRSLESFLLESSQDSNEKSLYDESGRLYGTRWNDELGNPHRLDGPAVILYEYENGKRYIASERWYLHGTKHRADGPAYTVYELHNGKPYVLYEKWFHDGSNQREGGPADTSYYSNGNIHREEWKRDGSTHREDGPAYIEYYRDGSLRTMSWLQYDTYLRIIKWYDDGTTERDEWSTTDPDIVKRIKREELKMLGFSDEADLDLIAPFF